MATESTSTAAWSIGSQAVGAPHASACGLEDGVHDVWLRGCAHAVLIALFPLLAACGADEGSLARPIFDVDTNTVVFSPQGLGTSDQQVIVVRNEQDDDRGQALIIDSAQLANIPSSPRLDWCGGSGCPVVRVMYCIVDGAPASGGACTIDNFQEARSIELPPLARVDVLVEYFAETSTQLDGEVRFDTNAVTTNVPGANDGVGVVELVVPALAGRLDINPDPVNFGRASSDEQQTVCRDTLFRNIGNDALTVSDWSVLGGGGVFTVSPESTFAAIAVPPPSERTDGGIVIPPGAAIPIRLCFTPVTDDSAGASLSIQIGAERQFVTLAGNGAEPCIEVNFEQGYDYGRVPVGEARPAVFEITNCASFNRGETLLVATTELVPAAGSDGPVVGYAIPTPPGDLALEPGESAAFVVTCTPQDFIPYTGILQINSNDSLKPQLDIGLNCLGTDRRPPTADIGCRILGDGLSFEREVFASRADTVECSAAASTGQLSNIVGWQWSMDVTPADSEARFELAAAEVTTFVVDREGRYELSAVVIDDLGVQNKIFCDSDDDGVPDLLGCEQVRDNEDASINCVDASGGFDQADCQAARRDRVVVVAE